MSTRIHSAAALLALSCVVAIGCSRRLPETSVSAAPIRETPDAGSVSFSALADPVPALPRLADGEELHFPRPLGSIEPPLYPRRALEGKSGEATVVVRFVIGVDGFVSSVSDSPLMASSPGPYAGDFRAAVEEAVRRWRFTPARILRLAEGEDYDGDGRPDYRRLVGGRELPFYLDVRFEFRIVDGEGVVGTSFPPR